MHHAYRRSGLPEPHRLTRASPPRPGMRSRTAAAIAVGVAVGVAVGLAIPGTIHAQDTSHAARAAAVAKDSLVGRRARPEIQQVAIRGAHAIPVGDIEASISTTESHCRGVFYLPFCVVSKSPYFYQRFYLDQDEMRRDILRIRILYWKRGYRLTSVDTAVIRKTPTTVRVRFTIHEGPPTRIVNIALIPDSLFPVSNRRRLVRLRTGEPLDLFAFDTTALLLTHWMWSRGYGDATIDTTFTLSGQPPSDSATRVAAAAGRIKRGDRRGPDRHRPPSAHDGRHDRRHGQLEGELANDPPRTLPPAWLAVPAG